MGGPIESLSQWVMEWFTVYAYEPEIVYMLVIGLMLLSGFGLPLPEEVVIISSSLLAYMARHPELYPPPEAGARGVNVYVLAVVCFMAVFLSDLLVFHIGRSLGYGATQKKWFQSIVSPRAFRRARFWTTKYGALMAGVFRFLPGIRFPGHLACGALGITRWKFILVDSIVIVLTIPTQVFLIAFFGEDILAFMNKFKLYIVGVVVIVMLVIFYKIFQTIRAATIARTAKRSAVLRNRPNFNDSEPS